MSISFLLYVQSISTKLELITLSIDNYKLLKYTLAWKKYSILGKWHSDGRKINSNIYQELTTFPDLLESRI